VGSFPGAGDDDPVFDLGGNVAEWVVDADDAGKLMGSSADMPADPNFGEPAEAYRGFRVLREGS
jgi:hypothetical protein